MNIRKRMLKVANNLMEDIVKSFEMTEEEWKKYNELHPNAKRENHQIVPDGKNQNGNGRKIQMTDEQKIIDSMTDKQKKLHSALSLGTFNRSIASRDKNTHPLTLDKLSKDENSQVRSGVATNHNTHPKTLDNLSKDENKYVRKCVAGNLNTSKETLDNLSNDDSFEVRIAACRDPKIIHKFFEESVPYLTTISEFAKNSFTQDKTLNKMIDYINQPYVEGYRALYDIMDNKNATKETIKKAESKKEELDKRGKLYNIEYEHNPFNTMS